MRERRSRQGQHESFACQAIRQRRQLLFVLCGMLAKMLGVLVNEFRGEVWSTAPRLTRSVRSLAVAASSLRLVP
jgi:hypothetical protein